MTGAMAPPPVATAPVVTVVLPVYNSGHTLGRAIQSVLDQTFTAFELLIIDDGSTDQSLMVARTYAGGDERVRVRVVALDQNGGKARAMNAAAEMARGAWIAILDADDRYLPTRLAVMVAAAEAHAVDMVADNQIHLDDATGRVVRQAFDVPGPGRVVGLTDFIAHSDPGANFDFGILKPMIRKSFLRSIDLAYHPGAKLAEDFYFLMEFFAAGGRAWLVHQPLYEWTLPFSPSARRWTSTGNGAWRYDYRNALATNLHFQAKLGDAAPAAVIALLDQRAKEYGVMIHYLDAQRVLADSGNRLAALTIIATHPSTWPLLARRVVGRVGRALRTKPMRPGVGS